MSQDIPQKPAKRGYVDFLENRICGDKNISDLDYGGDNLSQGGVKISKMFWINTMWDLSIQIV